MKRIRMGLLGLLLALTALVFAGGVALADPPSRGNHPHNDNEDPVQTCKPGNDDIDICASRFKFEPKNLPSRSFPDDGVVKWFNKDGNHNVSICKVGTADPSTGICGRGHVINGNNGEDFAEGESVFFNFDSTFAGETVNYFCRFHGKNKGMVGAVAVPGP